jgi:hypothetical protein
VERLRSNTSSNRLVHYIQTELRSHWLNVLDKYHENALHVLVKSHVAKMRAISSTTAASADNDTTTNSNNNILDESVQVLAWMITNGCDINAQNYEGNTALHIALLVRVDSAIVRCLLLHGADVKRLRNHQQQTVFDLLQQDNELQRLYGQVFQVIAPLAQSLSASNFRKLKGYSYLSVYLATQQFEKPSQ